MNRSQRLRALHDVHCSSFTESRRVAKRQRVEIDVASIVNESLFNEDSFVSYATMRCLANIVRVYNGKQLDKTCGRELVTSVLAACWKAIAQSHSRDVPVHVASLSHGTCNAWKLMSTVVKFVYRKSDGDDDDGGGEELETVSKFLATELSGMMVFYERETQAETSGNQGVALRPIWEVVNELELFHFIGFIGTCAKTALACDVRPEWFDCRAMCSIVLHWMRRVESFGISSPTSARLLKLMTRLMRTEADLIDLIGTCNIISSITSLWDGICDTAQGKRDHDGQCGFINTDGLARAISVHAIQCLIRATTRTFDAVISGHTFSARHSLNHFLWQLLQNRTFVELSAYQNTAIVDHGAIDLFGGDDEQMVQLMIDLFNLFYTIHGKDDEEDNWEKIMEFLFGGNEESSDMDVDAMKSWTRHVLLEHVFHPVRCVQRFISMIHFDTDVMLDMLIGNETEWLSLLLTFLKECIIRQPSKSQHFNGTAASRVQRETVHAMEVLHSKIIRLHEIQLFPYNPQPLLRRLSQFVKMYEYESTKPSTIS